MAASPQLTVCATGCNLCADTACQARPAQQNSPELYTNPALLRSLCLLKRLQHQAMFLHGNLLSSAGCAVKAAILTVHYGAQPLANLGPSPSQPQPHMRTSIAPGRRLT